MKIDQVKRVAREDLPDAPKGEWLDTLLTTQNQQSESIIQALRGNLNVADNMADWFYEGRFKHGVEQLIRVPKGKPSPAGVTAVMTKKLPTDAASVALPVVQSVSMRYTNQSSGTATEQVGVTVYYQSDLSVINSFTVRNSAVGAIVSGTDKVITAIDLPPGTWQVRGNGLLTGTLTGTTFKCGCVVNGTALPNDSTAYGDRAGKTPTVSTANSDVSIAIPAFEVDLTTSPTTPVYLVGNVAFSAGTPGLYGRISALRIKPDPATTANVTLRFHGG